MPISVAGQEDRGPTSRAQVGTPVILWPFDSMANSSLTPEFMFKANYSGSGGLTYTIEIADNKVFDNILRTYESNLDAGFRSVDLPGDTQPFLPNKRLAFVPFNPLDDGETYWWRVRAEAASVPGSASEWSEVRSTSIEQDLVHVIWSQRTPDQLMSGESHHIEAKGNGVMLGTADVVVFRETFPTTTLNATNWPVTDGPVTIDSLGIHEPSEPNALRLNGHDKRSDSAESRELDLSEFSKGTLDLHWQAGGGANGPDPGEFLRINVWLNDSSWYEVFVAEGNGTNMDEFVHEQIELPIGSFHQGFRIWISNNAFGAGDDWFIDDIVVRCRSYKDGSLTSGPIQYDDGPERRTGWSVAWFKGKDNLTVAVETSDGGPWVQTGISAQATGSMVTMDISGLGEVAAIRLMANFTGTDGTLPSLETWSVEWNRPDIPYVDVLRPGPGEVLGANDDYIIRWEAMEESHPLAQNPVSILFSDNGSNGPFTPVVRGVANSGEYLWKVPSNLSEDCYIRIEVIDDRPVPMVGSDLTDGPFSIVIEPPKVTLLTPNGGENLYAGDTFLIRWVTETGSFELDVMPISIYLSTNGALGDYEPLFEDIGDWGNVSWRVPNVDSGTCFLKIVVKDTQDPPVLAEDVSDLQFTTSPDDIPPYVVQSDPKDKGKGFPPQKSISIIFSEDMDRRSAEEAFMIKPTAKGDFIWYERTMVFVPSQGLQATTTYRITVDSRAKDSNGNNMETTYTASFDTGDVKETALQRWSYALMSVFIIGLGVGIGVGGLYLKKRTDDLDAANDPTIIDEIFLMSKSGKLIKHFTRRLKPDVDQDILSGMLVAVQNFVKDTFKGEAGDLDELTFGEFRILIGHGRYSMIAAVVKGPDPDRLKDQLLRCVGEMEKKERAILKDWDGDSAKVPVFDPFMRGLIAGKYRKD